MRRLLNKPSAVVRPALFSPLLLISMLMLSGSVLAQDEQDSGEPADSRPAFVPTDTDDSGQLFVLKPEPEPSPALKFRLLPDFTQTRPGNAAVFYGKVMAEQTNFFSNQELQNSIINLASAPLSEVKESEIAAQAIPEGSYQQLRFAALCESCDWQVPVRYDKPTWEILLPELQQTRNFARLMAVRARYQIAHGQFEDAIETLQTGYVLAANDASGPTYVHFLVGVAVKGIMDEQLMCMIQQPGAPNLYWALAALPDPLLDLRVATQLEQNFLILSFPELMDLSIESAARYSDEHWRQLLIHVMEISIIAKGNWNFDDPDVRKQALLAAGTAASEKHEQARRHLIESGLSAESVAKMSKSQVVLMAGMEEFHRFNEDVIKWTFLPYHQAVEGILAAENRLSAEEDDRILNLAASISPSVHQIFAVRYRTLRQTRLLMLMEAVRMYAAANDGKLPENLEAITQAPVPIDPVTGQPFVYELKTGHAMVTGPELPGSPLNVKLKVAKQ